MPSINKTLLVPFTAQQMYDLVNDIEAYPQFLPWCKATTIHSCAEKTLEATICIAKGIANYSICTTNNMIPYKNITMQYKSGPFKTCSGSWQFVSLEQEKKCQILFNIDYEFSNKLVALAVEPLFNPIASSLIDAFYNRAVEIYAR